MEFLAIAVIVFFGILTQSMIGFGLGLIAMPLLIHFLNPVQSAAFLALVALPLQILIIRRYRHALHIRPSWRVLVGSLAGIPTGILLISRLDQHIILTALGILLIAYSLYSLFNLRLPPVHQTVWGFGFGFASGVLGGAYNTAGPPLVIYGRSLDWKPEQFKANMQVMLMISNTLAIFIHVITGHVDWLVLENLLVSLPVIACGTVLGFWLSQRINEKWFRKAVLVALLLIGVRLLLP